LWAPAVMSTTVGSATPGGGDAAQVVEQHVGVVIDGGDAVGGEELREEPHHHLAVLEHVGDARGDAQVVLEDAEFAGVVAHDVDAGDVGVDAAGDVDALHLRAVLRVAEHLLRGDHARLQDLLVVVNVVDEGVQRPHALLQAAFEPDPFFEGQHAGHDVEGDEAFGAFFLAVDGEGDADPVEQGVGLGALLAPGARRAGELLQLTACLRGRPNIAIRGDWRGTRPLLCRAEFPAQGLPSAA
jgi:hypothetical protein